MAYDEITYANKVENNGITPAGRFGADDLNEIKAVTNANGANFDGRIDALEAGGGIGVDVSQSTVVSAGSTEARKLTDRFADTVNVKDFGAVGDGVTDDTASFNLAIAAASEGGTVKAPAGNYIITVPSLVFDGKSIRFDLQDGGLFNGTAENIYTGPKLITEYGPNSPAGVGYNYKATVLNDTAAVGAAKVDGESILMYFGGGTATGGRHGLEVTTVLAAPTSPTNPDRNYVGIASVAIASVPDNGVLPASPEGAVFGMNPVARLNGGATGFLNLSGIECNVEAAAGSSVYYKSGLQVVSTPLDVTQGTTYDAALSLSNMVGSTGWNHGLMFSAANGVAPITASGTLIGTVGSHTVDFGLDISSYTCTTAAIRTAGFSVDPTGSITSSGSNAAIELGNKLAANTPFIDFNSSGNNNDYDARIIGSGGSGSLGEGEITVQSAILVSPSNFRFSAALGDYVDDAAAATAGVAINQVYRTGSTVKVRVA